MKNSGFVVIIKRKGQEPFVLAPDGNAGISRVFETREQAENFYDRFPWETEWTRVEPYNPEH